MKTTFIFIFIAALSVFTDICGDSSQGELLKDSGKKYVRENLDYKTDYNGKRVAVEGYIYIDGTAEQEGSKLTLTLFTQPKGQGERLFNFQTKSGDGKNTVTLPDLGKGKTIYYKAKEYEINADKLVFNDNDGVSHPITDKVRLSVNIEYIVTFKDEFSHMTDPMNDKHELYAFYAKNSRFDQVK